MAATGINEALIIEDDDDNDNDDEKIFDLVLIKQEGDISSLVPADSNETYQAPNPVAGKHVHKVHQCMYDKDEDTICQWKVDLRCIDSEGKVTTDTIQPGVWVASDGTMAGGGQFKVFSFTAAFSWKQKPFRNYYQRFTEQNNGKVITTVKQLHQFFKQRFGEKPLKCVSGKIQIDDEVMIAFDNIVYHGANEKQICQQKGVLLYPLVGKSHDRFHVKYNWSEEFSGNLKKIHAFLMVDDKNGSEYLVEKGNNSNDALSKNALIPARFVGPLQNIPKTQKRRKKKKRKKSSANNDKPRTFKPSASSVKIKGIITCYTTSYATRLPQYNRSLFPNLLQPQQFNQQQQSMAAQYRVDDLQSLSSQHLLRLLPPNKFSSPRTYCFVGPRINCILVSWQFIFHIVKTLHLEKLMHQIVLHNWQHSNNVCNQVSLNKQNLMDPISLKCKCNTIRVEITIT